MARLHQLKMLLWKNYQVKRRMPWILIIETIIPFVLFILLGLVRYNEPLQRMNTRASAQARPLPSAGITAMMQYFVCEALPLNEGLPFLTENSTYFQLLTKIDEVYRVIENLPLESNFSPELLERPKLSYILKGVSEIAENLPISDSCKNSSAARNLTDLIYGGIVKFYETICGGLENVNNRTWNNDNDDNNNSTLSPESILLYSKQSFSAFFMFWQKFLNGQLKILYTPGRSKAVQNVIKKANATFEFAHRLTVYAERWLANFSSVARRRFPEKEAQINLIDGAACWWLNLTAKVNLSVYVPFDKEYEAIDYSIYQAERDNITVYAVIVFNVNETETNLRPHTAYKIRMNSTYLYSVRKLRPLYWSPLPRSWDFFYYTSGFMFLQDTLDRAIISSLVGFNVTEPGTYSQLTPVPCYLYDVFLFVNSMILPLCMTISYVYTAAILVQNIVSEKENGLKEFMKVMGLSNSVHGAAWFITAIIPLTISVTVVTFILVFTNVLAHSNLLIIWLILEIYAVATITFSFLVSSLFSKAKIASAAAGMLYFLSYVPSMTIGLQEEFAGVAISPALKMLTCFLSTSAFGVSCKYIGLRESEGIGVHWNNLAVSPIEHDSFTLLHSVGILIVDVFLYAVLAWYIENVKPGDFGIPKPWYFPFTIAYWTGAPMDGNFETYCPSLTCNKNRASSISTAAASEDDPGVVMDENKNNSYEPDPSDLKLGVEIDRLTKVYDNGKVAVNNLSLKLYESQITTLLGHNGAGKSSAMSVLCGILPPSFGTVRIYGLDIRANLDVVRNSVGYCPQHNILIDYLTPEEHLQFYSGLKRTSESNMSKENVEKMLEDVGLGQKKSDIVAHLSGGMKRKLSIALAFLGGSRLVILDEPTAGVDPYSRRAIWDLIIKYKTGRTILMSTHHMDEADTLSDRIAVISNGALKCCGSSLFLRSKFCDGYHLICVKNDNKNTGEETVQFVKKYFQTAYLTSETKDELHFIIPYNEERNGKMVPFFKQFDVSLEELGIASFGVYDSTLEEAFLRMTGTASNNSENFQVADNICDATSVSSLAVQTNNVHDSTVISEFETSNDEEHAGCCFNKHVLHFRALLIKRFIYVRRSWKVLLSQIFLPALFIATAMSMSLSTTMNGDPEPFALLPSQYNAISQPVGIYTPTTNYAVRNESRPTNVTGSDGWIDAGATDISQTLHLISGLSSSCLLRNPKSSIEDLYKIGNVTTQKMADMFNPECKQLLADGVQLSNFKPRNYSLPEQSNYYPMCTCLSDSSGLDCGISPSKPPQYQMMTGDYLVDIGSQNMTEYLLYTTNYFKLHRYGALNYGFEMAHVPENFGDGEASDLRGLAVRRVAVSYFDNRGFHAQPIYLNVINNAILRANVQKRPELGNPAAYGITTYNHPINGTDKVSFQDMAVQGTDMIIAVFIIIAMSFVPASFVVFVVYERSLLVKHIQFMAGLHPVTYWLANYTWDLLNYMIPAACCMLILLAFNVPAYVSGDNLPAIIALFMLYGWSMTPTMYPTSFLLNEPSKAYVFLVVVNLFVGTTCLITTSVLDIFSQNPILNAANDVLKIAFLPVPSYCLGRGIMDVALNHYTNQLYILSGKHEKVVSPLAWNVTIQKYLAMTVEGLFFFALTIILEIVSRRDIVPDCWSCSNNNSQGEEVYNQGDDVDVAAERKRIVLDAGSASVSSTDDLLVIDRLSKEFRPKSGRILAVDQLTVGMSQGECFGLLGLNGAGKSTTFSMLSGITSASSGEARLGSELLCSHRMPSVDILRTVGYCPQTDPLLEELTGREHLQFYARIHNIPSSKEAAVVNNLLEKMGLETCADKPSRTYSGGMKRKLSAALALIGNPKVVLLDEPTTGMDPRSRRFLWDIILKLRKENRLVLLTSHSMEECEALCSRLAVMVAGKLKCLGSTQHLKNKFGKGYTITVRLPLDPATNQLAVFRKETFLQVFCRYEIPPGLFRVVAQRHHTVELALLTPRPDLSKLFDALAHLRQTKIIAEFSVSQNTLDSVFLHLANNNERHPSLTISENGVPLGNGDIQKHDAEVIMF